MMTIICRSKHKEQIERLDSAYVYTYCKLKAYKSSSNEFVTTVKLEINNFDNNSDSGITIGHWKYKEIKKDCGNWVFIPVTSSHWELISDLFYIKNLNYIPREVGEFCECNVSMETLSNK